MIIALLIGLSAMGLMAGTVLTMKYDMTNTEVNEQAMYIAPFSIVELDLGNANIYSETITIQIDNCPYSGLIQAVIEPKKPKPTKETLKVNFTKIARYWPQNTTVRGYISCTYPNNITWYWRNMDTDPDINNHCIDQHLVCTSEEPIQTTELMHGKRENDNMITIELCDKGEKHTATAEFNESVPNLKKATFHNLDIVENTASTTATLSSDFSRIYLFLSTKYLQHSNHMLDSFKVEINFQKRGVLWKISVSIIAFLVLYILLMASICACLRKCRREDILYITFTLVTQKNIRAL